MELLFCLNNTPIVDLILGGILLFQQLPRFDLIIIDIFMMNDEMNSTPASAWILYQ